MDETSGGLGQTLVQDGIVSPHRCCQPWLSLVAPWEILMGRDCTASLEYPFHCSVSSWKWISNSQFAVCVCCPLLFFLTKWGSFCYVLILTEALSIACWCFYCCWVMGACPGLAGLLGREKPLPLWHGCKAWGQVAWVRHRLIPHLLHLHHADGYKAVESWLGTATAWGWLGVCRWAVRCDVG